MHFFLACTELYQDPAIHRPGLPDVVRILNRISFYQSRTYTRKKMIVGISSRLYYREARDRILQEGT